MIAIIAILASILLPALNQARERSYRTKCISNLKQLAMAEQFYADAYDGGPVPGGDVPRGFNWPVIMQDANLISSDKILQCPSQKKQVTSSGKTLSDGRIAYEYYQNYGTNTATSANITTVNGVVRRNTGFRKFGAIKNPSRKLLIIDCDTDRSSGVWNLTGMSFSQYVYRYSVRHDGGMNAMWCDLHVSYAYKPLMYNDFNTYFSPEK